MDDCGDLSNDGHGDGYDSDDDSTKYESDDDMEASDSVSEGHGQRCRESVVGGRVMVMMMSDNHGVHPPTSHAPSERPSEKAMSDMTATK